MVLLFSLDYVDLCVVLEQIYELACKIFIERTS